MHLSERARAFQGKTVELTRSGLGVTVTVQACLRGYLVHGLDQEDCW